MKATLGELKVHDKVLETLDRTVQHLRDNKVNPDETKLVLGTLLNPDSDKESFTGNPQADAFLTREYRAPFVVPSEA